MIGLRRLDLRNNSLTGITKQMSKTLTKLLLFQDLDNELEMASKHWSSGGLSADHPLILLEGNPIEFVHLPLLNEEVVTAWLETLVPVNSSFREFVLVAASQRAKGVSALARILRKPTTQTEVLQLGANLIGPDGMVDLALAFEGMPLRVLHLEGNMIKDRGAVAIAHALSGMPRIEILDLDSNKIGGTGFTGFASISLAEISLKELTFSNNPELGKNLSNVEALCHQISGSKLENVKLDNTGLTDAGLLVIAKMLGRWSTVRKLSVSENKFTERSIMVFANALNRSVLTFVNLRGSTCAENFCCTCLKPVNSHGKTIKFNLK